jgi:hypothetical protein
MKKILLITFLLLSLKTSFVSSQNTSPCSSSEFSQFDFWIGKWNLKWLNEDGSIGYGTNNITKILDDCVIEEHFTTADSSFKGKSVSTYSTHRKLWLQTWVDNNGAYLDFAGGFKNGKMILSRKILNKETKEILQRMVWYNITENELDWNWELSEDNGSNWKTNWKIHYTRAE